MENSEILERTQSATNSLSAISATTPRMLKSNNSNPQKLTRQTSKKKVFIAQLKKKFIEDSQNITEKMQIEKLFQKKNHFFHKSTILNSDQFLFLADIAADYNSEGSDDDSLDQSNLQRQESIECEKKNQFFLMNESGHSSDDLQGIKQPEEEGSIADDNDDNLDDEDLDCIVKPEALKRTRSLHENFYKKDSQNSDPLQESPPEVDTLQEDDDVPVLHHQTTSYQPLDEQQEEIIKQGLSQHYDKGQEHHSAKKKGVNILEKKQKPEKKKKTKEEVIHKKQRNQFQWPVFRRMFKYARQQWQINILSSLFMLGQAVTQMYIPKLCGELLDATGKFQDLNRLNYYALLAFGVYIVNAFCDFMRTFLYHLLGEKIVVALRNDCYKKFIQADVDFHDRIKSGELLSRLGSDITMVKSATSGNLGTLVRHIVTSIGNLGILLYLSWKLSLSIFVCLPLFIISSSYCVQKTKKLQKKYQTFLSKITQFAGECFHNIRTVKAFSNEEREIQKFQRKSNKAYTHGYKQSLAQGLGNGIEGLFNNFSTLAVLWFGGYLVLSEGGLTAGQLATFLMYNSLLVNSATSISQCLQKITTATGACERLFELMDIKPSISTKKGTKLDDYKVCIEYKDVVFNYPTTPDVIILSKFNLKIEPGDQIAFVGTSGSGKSTIIRLAERFYDVAQGQVLIDGVDIKDIDIRDWRNQVGYVQQEPILFSGTIEQNITYGVTQCTQENLDDACKAASAYDFIHNRAILPLGYKTNVGESGGKLSGGQKQRIAIARALLRKPKVLILDEATSALDAESEHQVQSAIDDLMVQKQGQLTILIIAHRLSTIAKCQKIIFLDKGKIIESGTHKELLEKKGAYHRLVQRQLSEKV